MKGDQLSTEEREQLLNKLVAYTGISKTYWDKSNLRINQPQFRLELLLDSGISVGRYDSRYTGITQNMLGEYATYDPNYEDVAPAFISALMNYYTTELKVSKDKTYNIWAQQAYTDFKWDWTHQSSSKPPNTEPDLLNAMSNNPSLKVLVLNGLFDLATPFAGTEYTFDHMGLNKKIKRNVIFKYYEAGHMMYVRDEAAAKFKKDVAGFISSCLK
jgi:carboxypeptidase C (cathepsin A)